MDFQAAIKELQETAVVMSGIQARQAELLKAHSEWLHAHNVAMMEIREAGRRTDERIAALGERINRMVSTIGELLSGERKG